MVDTKSQAMRRRVVALVPDLMDRSRIEPVARSVGVSLEFVTHTSELRALDVSSVGLVIVDLDAPGSLSALSDLASVRTVGFGSHVDRDLLAAARQAGHAEVVSRSVLFHRLPEILRAMGSWQDPDDCCSPWCTVRRSTSRGSTPGRVDRAGRLFDLTLTTCTSAAVPEAIDETVNNIHLSQR